MSTQSFYEDIELETEEEMRILEEAFEEADRRGPIDTSSAVEPIEDPEEAWRVFSKVIEKNSPPSDPQK